MGILCVDIGGGTQDICYYTGNDSFENSFKMVLPSPTKRICSLIGSIEDDIFASGETIGGGDLASALSKHVQSGHRVYITRRASMSVKDDPERVKKLGLTVVEEVVNPNVTFDELDIDIIRPAVEKSIGRFAPYTAAVAAQDHGYVPWQSDRVTRFSFLKNFLSRGLGNAFFENETEIPEGFGRWKSLARSVRRKLPKARLHLSDTAIIAALGAASVTSERPVITVDAGNCHTFAALLGPKNEITAFFEHHTHLLTPETISVLLNKLSKCELDNSEIFDGDGHGAHVFKKLPAPGCSVLVTGPVREKLFPEGSGAIFAYPGGDTMMAGPVGMLLQSGVRF